MSKRLAALAGMTTIGLSTLAPVTATAVPAGAESVVINEIVYGDNLQPGIKDSVELYNLSDEPVDLTGWSLYDDKDRPGEGDLSGTIQPGEFLVLTQGNDFDFGLGKGDAVRLFNGGELVDSYTYDITATENWSRDPDGTGEFKPGTSITLGGPNDTKPASEETALILNEIDSSPSDWVEFINPGKEALDISGYEIRDNSDDHRWRFPVGATIKPGEYLVVDADTNGEVYDDNADTFSEGVFGAAIGIGSGDSIRVYDPDGTLIQETSWKEHATIDGDASLATISRCPDTTGTFQVGNITKGEPNDCPPPNVVVNEIETKGDETDWVEIMNIGESPVDISGWYMYDDKGDERKNKVTPVADGTTLAPGEFYVFDENKDFSFGLGKDDLVSVFDASGQLIAEERTTPEHAEGTMSRCPDGRGEFIDAPVGTKGAPNDCGNPVVLNEIESDGDDWIELANPRDEALDVSGLVIRDDDDDHEYIIPENTTIPAEDYLVIDNLGFGLGGSDSVRVFDGERLIQEYSWQSHAHQTYGRCPDISGDFTDTRESTPGERNKCPGIPDRVAYPSISEPVVVDKEQMFLEDSSGLDFADGHLWAVDNGTGKFWKLVPKADGTVVFADGWKDGKRARFIKDADNPSAAGPDAEGITVGGNGLVYLAVERDNSDKATNYNVVLEVDPNAEGPDVVASREWDLTDILPAVSANTGIEAVEWISNADATDRIYDENTDAAYDPSNYPNAAADGVFLVALEDDGKVYAFSLGEDGSATLLSSYDAYIGGAMGLDYMPGTNRLRVMADDGFNGALADIFLDGTKSPEVLQYDRPEGMPNLNNEGYAESHPDVDGNRYAWFFADGAKTEALRAVKLADSGRDDNAESTTGDESNHSEGAANGNDHDDNTGAGDSGSPASGSSVGSSAIGLSSVGSSVAVALSASSFAILSALGSLLAIAVSVWSVLLGVLV